jgi:hypothetical protein
MILGFANGSLCSASILSGQRAFTMHGDIFDLHGIQAHDLLDEIGASI